jgi:hypothetical protein
MAGGCVAMAYGVLNRPDRAAASLVISSAVLVLGVFALGAHVADRHQQADQLLAPINQSRGPMEVASFKVLEPGWVYYGRQPIREIRGPRQEAAAFLGASRNRYLITTERKWQEMAQELPDDVRVLVSVDRFLKGGRLVLVGRSRGELTRQAGQGELGPR